MKIDLQELVEQQILTAETAEKIKAYYQRNQKDSHQRLLLIFGIIGAVLTGLGIILLIAHNWDNFSRLTKTILALLPLLLSQAIGFYTLLRKYDSRTWREVSAVLIFFSVAAAISMIAQIYHISGDYPRFLMTWMLLSLPLVYIFRSSFTSLLYIALVTHFVTASASWQYRYILRHSIIYYLIFLAGILPYYYRLIKQKPQANITTFHHWFIALSVLISLNTLHTGATDWLLLANIALLGIYILIGLTRYFQSLGWIKNAYSLIGTAGLGGLLVFLSFDFFWKHEKHIWIRERIFPDSFWAFIVLSFIYVLLFFLLFRKQIREKSHPFIYLPLVLIAVYLVSFYIPAGQILTNLTGLITGIYFIRTGNQEDDLLKLNLGMLLISALILARFFDAGISFIIRGILFIVLGLAFFAVNYILVRKRKKNEA